MVAPVDRGDGGVDVPLVVGRQRQTVAVADRTVHPEVDLRNRAPGGAGRRRPVDRVGAASTVGLSAGVDSGMATKQVSAAGSGLVTHM